MKPALFIQLLSLLLIGSLSSQPAPPATVDVWPEGKMPGTGASGAEAERPSKDAFHRITNVSRPTLTVFPAREKNAPAVIICPGGGYGYVVIDKEGTEIAKWLNTLGITGVVLKYRNPNNRDGAFQDVQRAVRLVRAHAKEWNVDAGKIGVMGFSAGGHLCARLSTNHESAAYPALDEVDKSSCRPDFAVLVYPAYLGKDGQVAPELPVSGKVPPTFIVHSEDDKSFIAGSKIYDAALTKSGVPHELALFPTGGHGYGMHCEKEAKAWPGRCRDWLSGLHEPATTGRIVLVGDSTVASNSGWGDAFAKLLGPGVECRNMGRGGRSSKSYRDEGHWRMVLDSKPDWVLIQFDPTPKDPARPDKTHLSSTGAEETSKLVAEEIRKNVPELAGWLVRPAP